MLYKKLLLTSIKNINGERSIIAIYHLLTGKKSIQTLQDAHSYQLTAIYGILPRLEERFFRITVATLKREMLIKQVATDSFIITNKGKKLLNDRKDTYLQFFNGLNYHKTDELFFNRLLLFIQMIVNLKKNNFSYIPIVDDAQITKWARGIYHQIKHNVDDTLLQLKGELETICYELTSEEANILIDRFTGYKKYGLSIHQLSNRYNYSPIDIQLIIIRIIHQMLTIIHQNKQQFVLLTKLLPSEKKKGFLTNSAKKTRELFKLGYDLEQIAHFRKLRLNTIQDHIVEIALYEEDFPFEQFLSEQTIEEIFHVLLKKDTYKLKEIKNQVSEHITYFEIRLALAKFSQEKEEVL